VHLAGKLLERPPVEHLVRGDEREDRVAAIGRGRLTGLDPLNE
jgi:hypothetical protein